MATRYLSMVDANNLQSGDDALVMKNYLNGYFAWPSQDPKHPKGRIVEPGHKFIVKYDDVATVLSSRTLSDGGIAIVGVYKKDVYPGGYKLVEVPVEDFPTQENPASLNDEQMIKLLSQLKKSKNKRTLIDYVQKNGISSHFFILRLLGLVKDIDLPHSVMLELHDLEKKLHFEGVKAIVFDDTQEKDRQSLLKRAGLK